MYNASTIMHIHIRSQASDWTCCVKRLFVCAQQSTLRAVASQGMQENWILAIMPKYGNSAPGPQKMNFFGNF